MLSRSRRTWRLAASSKPGFIGTGWHTRTKSARRNRPRCSATRSSTRSSSTVVDNRVLIATPVGAATGFTPRHCRKTTPTPSQTTPTKPAHDPHRPTKTPAVLNPSRAARTLSSSTCDLNDLLREALTRSLLQTRNRLLLKLSYRAVDDCLTAGDAVRDVNRVLGV